jgi:hypothetical protein
MRACGGIAIAARLPAAIPRNEAFKCMGNQAAHHECMNARLTPSPIRINARLTPHEKRHPKVAFCVGA